MAVQETKQTKPMWQCKRRSTSHTAQGQHKRQHKRTAQKDSTKGQQHMTAQGHSKRKQKGSTKRCKTKTAKEKHKENTLTTCFHVLHTHSHVHTKNQCSFCTQTCKNTCHAHFAHKRLKCKPSGKAKHSMAKKKHGKASQSKRSKWQRQTKKQSKQGDKTNTNGQQTKAKAMPSKC